MDYVLQILFVLGLMATGMAARRGGLITGAGTAEFARMLVGLFYPALILATLPRLSMDDLATHARMPLLVMGIAFAGLALGILAVWFSRPMPGQTSRAFLFNCLINNYLFLPLPLVLIVYGERGAALLFFSSVGYELILWTLGVFLMAPGGTARERVQRVLGLPLICILVSIAWIVGRDHFGIRLPDSGTGMETLRRVGELFGLGFETIGRATVAVSMLVAGSRIAVLHPRRMADARVWVVAGIRLVAVPLAVIALLSFVRLDAMSRGVLMIIAVMPSSIASVVFSERFGGDTEFIAGALLVTHLGALVTVPLFLAFAL